MTTQTDTNIKPEEEQGEENQPEKMPAEVNLSFQQLENRLHRPIGLWLFPVMILWLALGFILPTYGREIIANPKAAYPLGIGLGILVGVTLGWIIYGILFSRYLRKRGYRQ